MYSRHKVTKLSAKLTKINDDIIISILMNKIECYHVYPLHYVGVEDIFTFCLLANFSLSSPQNISNRFLSFNFSIIFESVMTLAHQTLLCNSYNYAIYAIHVGLHVRHSTFFLYWLAMILLVLTMLYYENT
jgi:hypothetical protein